MSNQVTKPGASFQDQVAALVAGGMNKSEAVCQAARDDPAAHQAYIRAHNEQQAARRLELR